MSIKMLGAVSALAIVFTSSFLLGGGTAQAGGICVSHEGAIVFEHGGGPNEPFCQTDGVGNTAIAVGNDSDARAIAGTDNTAIAVGNGSRALAGVGNGNNARAVGNGSVAGANIGNGNAAFAAGNGSFAVAYNGSNNTAIAVGSCDAEAAGSNGLTDECAGR